MSEKKYFHFLIYMLLITTYLPIAYLNLPPGIRSLKYFWGPLWLLSLLIRYNTIFLKKNMVYLVLFLLITSFILPNTIWSQREILYKEYDYWSSVFYETYYFIIAISVYYYLMLTKDYFFWKVIVRFTLILFSLTAMLTIVSIAIDPMYARDLTNSSLNFAETIKGGFLKRIGGATYGYLQSFVIVIPVIIYMFKQKIKFGFINRVYLFILLVLLIYSIIGTQFFANIIVALFSAIFAIQGKRKIKKSFIYASVILLLLLFTPDSFLVDINNSISNLFVRGSENYFKFKEFSSYLAFGAGTGGHNVVSGRADRYPLLLDSFVKSPFWGNSYSNNPEYIELGSQHLFFMGRLTEFGIFIFIFYVTIYYQQIKTTISSFKKSSFYFFYLISILSFLLLGLMKNISGKTMWFTLFVFIPGIFYLDKINKLRCTNNFLSCEPKFD